MVLQVMTALALMQHLGHHECQSSEVDDEIKLMGSVIAIILLNFIDNEILLVLLHSFYLKI